MKIAAILNLWVDNVCFSEVGTLRSVNVKFGACINI